MEFKLTHLYLNYSDLPTNCLSFGLILEAMAVVAAKIFAHVLFDFQKCSRKFDENLVNNILPYRFVLSFVHSILLLKPDIFHVIPLEASEGLFSPKDFCKTNFYLVNMGF